MNVLKIIITLQIFLMYLVSKKNLKSVKKLIILACGEKNRKIIED